jgi:hypothetical protein
MQFNAYTIHHRRHTAILPYCHTLILSSTYAYDTDAYDTFDTYDTYASMHLCTYAPMHNAYATPTPPTPPVLAAPAAPAPEAVPRPVEPTYIGHRLRLYLYALYRQHDVLFFFGKKCFLIIVQYRKAAGFIEIGARTAEFLIIKPTWFEYELKRKKISISVQSTSCLSNLK